MILAISSIVVCALAVIGLIATLHWLADQFHHHAIRRRMNAATRLKLPRATVRRLRANRIALSERLLARRAS